jgi:hypothetical protein
MRELPKHLTERLFFYVKLSISQEIVVVILSLPLLENQDDRHLNFGLLIYARLDLFVC